MKAHQKRLLQSRLHEKEKCEHEKMRCMQVYTAIYAPVAARVAAYSPMIALNASGGSAHCINNCRLLTSGDSGDSGKRTLWRRQT